LLACSILPSLQSDINDKMRAILIDWLVDVHLKFKVRA
jgi:cyclin B